MKSLMQPQANAIPYNTNETELHVITFERFPDSLRPLPCEVEAQQSAAASSADFSHWAAEWSHCIKCSVTVFTINN